jgi:hypothetical protein
MRKVTFWGLVFAILVGFFGSTVCMASEDAIAYVKGGKIYTCDMMGRNVRLAISIKGEVIKSFYPAPDRVTMAIVTKKDKVFLRNDAGIMEIMSRKGEVVGIIFLDDGKLIISAFNCVVAEGREQYSKLIHYVYSNGNLEARALSNKMTLMKAGACRVAAFDQSGTLEGSFKTYELNTGKVQVVRTPEPRNAFFPSISPSGRYLAYYYKDAKVVESGGGVGIKIYDLWSKKEKAKIAHIYCFPSDFGPEPLVWARDEMSLMVHKCMYSDQFVRNSFVKVKLDGGSFLHESEYRTAGQFHFLVEDSLGNEVLLLDRKREEQSYKLYRVPVNGIAEDRVFITQGAKSAKFIRR